MASTSTNLSANSVNNEINGVVSVAVKKRGQGKPMKLVATYDDYADAYRDITSEDGFDGQKWIELNTKTNKKGATVWFRCAKNLKCPRIKIYINNINDKYVVCIGTDNHIHEPEKNETTSSYGIDDNTKKYIIYFEGLHLKPSEILRELRELTPNLPSIIQLNNYLKTIRKTRGRLTNTLSVIDSVNTTVEADTLVETVHPKLEEAITSAHPKKTRRVKKEDPNTTATTTQLDNDSTELENRCPKRSRNQ
jgi:hypothetical protein